MKYPPLPESTVINGRSLFTAGDMRAYGLLCVQANGDDDEEFEHDPKPNSPKDDAAVKELLARFGMMK